MNKPTVTDWQIKQSERMARSRAVAGEYGFERIQPGLWVACHPSEPDRCYMIQLTPAGATCTCPDFVCTANPHGIRCKHILSAEQLYPDEAWQKMFAMPLTDIPWHMKNEQPIPDDFQLSHIVGDPFERE